ncbi:ParB/RepB/Spo0J family partition protein [Cognatishimia sp. 1_MG-2023]|uniref:ParB/RepB/Spo0J family partition protein n=1 Tax=Cognatishimia sp. 1_MG-2023 TaxID=3062642 RepID=UPI0026E1809C|nr:ParB/RepB/Spo0J family partition protein [Cognatishimia sp. 1_MG-2023]MDO6728274.1 ParB/RepB/Spo0J family partition protein [Cognatishimia sp. 1_MG-2023]
MTKKHDEIFDAVLSGIGSDERSAKKDRSASRFLKRGNAIGDKLSGEVSEKTLHWVDPARCKMWDRHNRNYALLTSENCADLIEGIQQQGQQEFPAVVRKVSNQDGFDYEVICGARRHFAISWLQANNYPQFKYLIEVRDLSDEEAFRLADIENRDRADISDFERARDYAAAVKLYYGGKQKAMAQRLQVSEAWLSRYLFLAKLPDDIIQAYPSSNDIKELHARTLKPFLAQTDSRAEVIDRAMWLRHMRAAGATSDGMPWNDPAKVLEELKRAGQGKMIKRKVRPTLKHTYSAHGTDCQIKRTDKGRQIFLEIDKDIPAADLRKLLDKFLLDRGEGL